MWNTTDTQGEKARARSAAADRTDSIISAILVATTILVLVTVPMVLYAVLHFALKFW